MPCKPTRVNGNRIRNFPLDHEEKLEEFKNYCKRDVEVERLISKRLSRYHLNLKEKEAYELDQEINDRGVLVDMNIVNSAMNIDDLLKREDLKRAKELTGIENPNSPVQLKLWLKEKGLEMKSLFKRSVEELLVKYEKGVEVDDSMNKILKLSL